MKKKRFKRDFDYWIDEYMYNCRSRTISWVSYLQRAALCCPLLILGRPFPGRSFPKKSSRNASHMRTVFLIKESLFDGKVLPRNCHAGQVLRASSTPSPKIEDAFFFFRMWSLGRHLCYLHRFTVPRKNFYAHTDVIAQRLKNGAELCHTIRGLCSMLTLNYEKCPQNRCFSA